MDFNELFRDSFIDYRIGGNLYTMKVAGRLFLWTIEQIRVENYELIKIIPPKDFKDRIEGMIRNGS